MVTRTKPKLWEKIKNQVKNGSKGGNPGQWSARKAQLAVKLYKKKGGGYIGKKSSNNSLTQWTKQKWRTKSGKNSVVGKNATKERYLPSKMIKRMSKKEYNQTTRAKRRSRKQYSRQPKKTRNKMKRYTSKTRRKSKRSRRKSKRSLRKR